MLEPVSPGTAGPLAGALERSSAYATAEERRRLPDNIVTIDFRRHLPLRPGERLLDLGSGNGRHTIEACRWPCRVVSVDVDVEELRRARYYLRAPKGTSPYDRQAQRRRKEGIRGWADFIVADAEHLPFRDGSFDKVMCTEVLEHIPDDKEGIRELYRVAKQGGDIAVSVPRYWPERVFWTLSWEYWHTPGGHVRIYRPGEMARHLREQGFDLHTTRYRHAFQSIYWMLRCTFGKNNEGHLLPRTMLRRGQSGYSPRQLPLSMPPMGSGSTPFTQV